MRSLASTVLTAALALAACGASSDPAQAPPRSEVDRFLDSVWPDGAGGTVLAAQGGRAVTCRAFGMADRESGTAARCDTVYDIGSITKQFTAAAVVALQAQGKLRVTDPVSRYVGPVPPDKRAITVHQLLTHTSGLVESLGDDDEPLSRDGMIAGALKSRLLSRPGTQYAYSNVGYSLLAAVVERASGVGYEQFLRTTLFGPAGMTSTGYVLPHWDRDRIAVEYDEDGRAQGRPTDHPWAPDGPYWNLRGNGGLLSTAGDMLRWHNALRGTKVLPAGARDALFTPYVAEDGTGQTRYGYGWVIGAPGIPGRIAWHDGGNGLSYAVHIRSLDDGAMVFWVSNHAGRDGEWNLEDLSPDLTEGLLSRARAAD